MATPFSDVYVKFNVLMQDEDLLSLLDQEEYEELLELFLDMSKSVYFKNCRQDLTDVDDDLKQFNETVESQAQWVISLGMRLIWLERNLYHKEKLRNKIGMRDYSRHSPNALIEKMTALVKQTKKDLDALIVSYSFDNFTGFN